MQKGFLIAAERSGTGKTMIVTALARALINRGLTAQCFKAGPDFIDPGYHAAATGRISRNLDGWMMGRDACLQTFGRAMSGGDIGVVEGVMGLYDGLAGAGDEGSSAQLAKWLKLPVVLIIDGSSISRSAGAVALGFEKFDPEVALAGIIFNKVGSPAHYNMLREGVREKCSAAVLGYIPRSQQWHSPERHLGLVMASERNRLQESVARMAELLERTVDVQKIIQIASAGVPQSAVPASPVSNSAIRNPQSALTRVQGSAIQNPKSKIQNGEEGSGFGVQDFAAGDTEFKIENSAIRNQQSAFENKSKIQNPKSKIELFPNPEPRTLNPRIAVARDEAFCFCYQDNIDILERFGAEIAFFSPLHDRTLPPGTQGLYLPGGYPELHAQALSRNAEMLGAIRSFCLAGNTAYAECGGFLYLLNSLTGLDGRQYDMAGVFSACGRMLPRLQRLGYIEIEALAGHPFLAESCRARGHEFHYSEMTGMPADIQRTCRVLRRKDGAEFSEGYLLNKTLAGYLHLHFASQPAFAENFVRQCAG